MGVCISTCTKSSDGRVLSPVDVTLEDSSISTETTTSWDSSDDEPEPVDQEGLATAQDMLDMILSLAFNEADERTKAKYTAVDFARDAAERALLDFHREEEEAQIAEAEAAKEKEEYEEALRQMEKERAEMEEADRAAEKELLEAEEAERIAEKERLEAEEAEAIAAKVRRTRTLICYQKHVPCCWSDLTNATSFCAELGKVRVPAKLYPQELAEAEAAEAARAGRATPPPPAAGSRRRRCLLEADGQT